MNKWCLLALVLAGWLAVSPAFTQTLELDAEQQALLDRQYEEHRTYPLMLELSREHRPEPLALVGVNVIPMSGKGLQRNQTVLIRDSRFERIGPVGQVPLPDDARVIGELEDLYLIPGLTEAHAHTQFSLSQFLVYLTRGITTVREMDGFEWMLRARKQATNNQLLIPNLYVAGNILSNKAWDFYMTQVDTVDEVRARVEEQAAAGYDSIKIHNSMPEPLFSALFDEAARQGLDVVGHIPQEISIAQAISAGMQTNEHFKGYLFDGDLSITDQDYVADTAGSSMWQVPTFANYHEHLRASEATQLAEAENSLRLVPGWMRHAWEQQAALPIDGLTELRQSIYPKSREIFTNLYPVTDRFVAGTDTGGYAFQVPGYALQEEIRIFESLGMTPQEALRTATLNAARAMGREQEMGAVHAGKRADFVLLRANPLASTANLAEIEAVGVRGIWLSRATLDHIESALEAIFSDSEDISSWDKLEFVVGTQLLVVEEGFPMPDYLAAEVSELEKLRPR
jgi:hypothetical protein